MCRFEGFLLTSWKLSVLICIHGHLDLFDYLSLQPGNLAEAGFPTDHTGNCRDVANAWTHAVATIFSDAVCSRIDYTSTPQQCTKSDATSCVIIRRGMRRSRLLVSSAGCRRLIGQAYYCKVHHCRWNAPHGESSIDCNIVGDVVGDYLVTGCFWTEALSIFQETENYRTLERMLRRRTWSAVAHAVATHAARPDLSELESMCLHAALHAFHRCTPSYPTIKRWLLLWVQKVLGPVVPQLAMKVCGSHGAIANIDFSACDARQMRQVKKGKEKRTFGGITGLGDVPLLPDLFAPAEDRPNIETILLTWLSLLRKQGLKPVGLNVDNIAKMFNLCIGCLDAGLPGAVLYTEARLAAAAKHVEAGGIVVDVKNKKVLGFELGQDALHVYYRLLKAINTLSLDAAWSIRCLRKWLGSLNPDVRFGRGDAVPIFGGADSVHEPPINSASDDALDLPSLLDVYFQGAALPTHAYEIFEMTIMETWQHPVHGTIIPRPAKVAILEDAALASALRNPGHGHDKAYV